VRDSTAADRHEMITLAVDESQLTRVTRALANSDISCPPWR